MEKEERKAIIRRKTAGAILMLACVFLPYSTMTEDYAERIESYSDVVIIEKLDMTVSDVKGLSLAEYAYIYGSMSQEIWKDTAPGIFYVVLISLVGFCALLAALFARGRKPIACILFGGFSGGLFHLLNWDFFDRGVIPNDSYDWAFAHSLFPVAETLLAIAAVWMLVKKIVVKRQLKAAAACKD